MKKIVILSSTPVRGGNSELLCEAFAEGARKKGHPVELIALREKEIHFCRGCEICVSKGNGCVQKDDMAELIKKVHQADVFVFATPIYFMSVSAQLKVFIDRFIAGEQFMRQSEGKEACLISVSASPDTEQNHLAANETFRGFLACLRTVKETGILNVGGSYAPGSVKQEDLKKAYDMGFGL